MKYLSALAVIATIFGPLHAQAENGKLGERIGSAVYGHHCAACHAPHVIMVASPKLHDERAWSQRLEKGFNAVLSNALNGIGAMPEMGGCSECSEAEIEAALRYMAAPALSATDPSGQ
nr:c-type cytochrome [Marinicella sp. W31]MDC2876109.1 c-type cytochrome [Marinicella sp. W31]